MGRKCNASLCGVTGANAVVPPDYVVSNAGTVNARGNYNEDGTHDGRPTYANSTAYYIYHLTASEFGLGPAWAVGATVGHFVCYYHVGTEATPYIGSYTPNFETAPNAVVAAG